MVPALVFEERLRVPAEVFDLDNFRSWVHSAAFPEQVRAAYIGGEIELAMSPEELETHNKLNGDLFASLWAFLRDREIGDLLPDRSLLVCPKARLVTEPDMMFVSWAGLRRGRVAYRERVKGSNRYVEVVGKPDLVVEIVSSSSVRKDTVLLKKQYFAAGISEYWLLDARGQGVDFKLFVPGPKSYRLAAADKNGYRFSSLFKTSFLVTRKRNPVGGFRYRLQHR